MLEGEKLLVCTASQGTSLCEQVICCVLLEDNIKLLICLHPATVRYGIDPTEQICCRFVSWCWGEVLRWAQPSLTVLGCVLAPDYFWFWNAWSHQGFVGKTDKTRSRGPKKLSLYANIAGGKVIRTTELTHIADLCSATMQRVCGVIGALDINLGKKSGSFPSRSLIFQWLFSLLSVEVAFIEQLYSHQTSGTLFYKQDLAEIGLQESWHRVPAVRAVLHASALLWPQSKGLDVGNQPAVPGHAQFQGRKTRNTDWFFFFSLAMILISKSFN